MLKWLKIIVRTLWSTLRSQQVLAIENLALRQQLAVLKLRHPRPRLTDADRLFWVVMSQIWWIGESPFISCNQKQLYAGIGKVFDITGAGKAVVADDQGLIRRSGT